ncbi:MAG: Holliday junction branch migration protein RuvA [Deltaproteobacteria bacterium]|nr:Holliday junction branch migration protein RuvA [Deltaproteobacteria bacterium]
MIAHLRGILLLKSTQSVIIDNGGVGYEVHVPLSTFYALPESGQEVELHIHTHVREDALALFGFHTALEKDLFLMLISVSGIGPRLGINILSGIGPGDLLEAVARADSLRLQAIPGVGRKTAERIVLELRERAQRSLGEVRPSAFEEEPPDHKVLDDALSALVNLGYPVKVAKGAVEKASRMIKEGNLEEMIKEALRILV